MLAAWYDRQGPAADVLHVGELPDPIPATGDVRVRLTVSGINPGDTKKRSGWLGNPMAFQRIIPHSDGAGVIDAVGPEVDPQRVGQRVWVFGAQSYRPFGTAAQFTVLPEHQTAVLPDSVTDEVGANLGIPGITAHRCVFSDGPVTGTRVLVHGVLGGVGSMAVQLARWNGASVVGTVRRAGDIDQVDPAICDSVVSLDDPDAARSISALAPGGIDRIIEVSLSDNIDLDTAVIAGDGVIAAYASRTDRPEIPFWPLLFKNVSVRLMGSDDFPVAAKSLAAHELTQAAAAGALKVETAATYPLADIARAHDRVDSGAHGRTTLTIPAA